MTDDVRDHPAAIMARQYRSGVQELVGQGVVEAPAGLAMQCVGTLAVADDVAREEGLGEVWHYLVGQASTLARLARTAMTIDNLAVPDDISGLDDE